jgi:hypothetical protein
MTIEEALAVLRTMDQSSPEPFSLAEKSALLRLMIAFGTKTLSPEQAAEFKELMRTDSSCP